MDVEKPKLDEKYDPGIQVRKAKKKGVATSEKIVENIL